LAIAGVSTLAFGFWLIVMDPRFISCDYSAQKFFAFIVVVVEQALADLNTFAFVLCDKLSWHTSHTDFMEAELVVDDFIGRTMTNLQRTRYFIEPLIHTSRRYNTVPVLC
jgi:hypothetical protein